MTTEKGSAPLAAADARQLLALLAAAEAGASGEMPVGAVAWDRWGRLLWEGGNATLAEGDPTAHAEIQALRWVARRLGNHRLEGIALGVSLQPCAMCLYACAEARVTAVHYAADRSGPQAAGVQRAAAALAESVVTVADPAAAGAVVALMRFFFEQRRG